MSYYEFATPLEGLPIYLMVVSLMCNKINNQRVQFRVPVLSPGSGFGSSYRFRFRVQVPGSATESGFRASATGSASGSSSRFRVGSRPSPSYNIYHYCKMNHLEYATTVRRIAHLSHGSSRRGVTK